MDGSPALASAPAGQVSPLPTAPAAPPWEVEADDPSPPPRAAAPRRAKAAETRIPAPRVHWSITALTVATAVVLVFGTQPDNRSGASVTTFAEARPTD